MNVFQRVLKKDQRANITLVVHEKLVLTEKKGNALTVQKTSSIIILAKSAYGVIHVSVTRLTFATAQTATLQ